MNNYCGVLWWSLVPTISWTQQKIPGSVKKWKVPGKTLAITTVSKEKKFEKKEKKWRRDNGGFQQQSTQRLLHRYDHMNSRNDQSMIRLKAIEAEYYYIEN